MTRLTMTVKRDAASKARREVLFLIDSGAVHSVVPRRVLKALGIKPFKKTAFILADGTTIERDVGGAHFLYRQSEGVAPVVFGEEGDSALLGATTLEALELALNPLTRELYPLPMTLMGDGNRSRGSRRRSKSRRDGARIAQAFMPGFGEVYYSLLSPVGTIESNCPSQSSLRDFAYRWASSIPALKRRAILKCPSGTGLGP